MSKRLPFPTVSRHYQFFKTDLEFLEKYFGPASPRAMSMNEIVRTLVHDAVKKARARLADRLDHEPEPEALPQQTLDF